MVVTGKKNINVIVQSENILFPQDLIDYLQKEISQLNDFIAQRSTQIELIR